MHCACLVIIKLDSKFAKSLRTVIAFVFLNVFLFKNIKKLNFLKTTVKTWDQTPMSLNLPLLLEI